MLSFSVVYAIHMKFHVYYVRTCVYSGISNNGHSEEQTTSLQRTICVSPTDNRMHSIHFLYTQCT